VARWTPAASPPAAAVPVSRPRGSAGSAASRRGRGRSTVLPPAACSAPDSDPSGDRVSRTPWVRASGAEPPARGAAGDFPASAVSSTRCTPVGSIDSAGPDHSLWMVRAGPVPSPLDAPPAPPSPRPPGPPDFAARGRSALSRGTSLAVSGRRWSGSPSPRRLPTRGAPGSGVRCTSAPSEGSSCAAAGSGARATSDACAVSGTISGSASRAICCAAAPASAAAGSPAGGSAEDCAAARSTRTGATSGIRPVGALPPRGPVSADRWTDAGHPSTVRATVGF
jgi:hypothetical protein